MHIFIIMMISFVVGFGIVITFVVFLDWLVSKLFGW